MTQIDLWKSYQGTFLTYATSHPHLIAGEFIKNVSSTFNGASAQVAGQNKYVIRGIKPRKIPVDSEGRNMLQCHWAVHRDPASDPASSIFAGADGPECGQWFRNKETMLGHILARHLAIPEKIIEGAPADAQAQFDWSAAPTELPQTCRWSSCKHTIDIDGASTATKWKLLARHINTHLPDRDTKAAAKQKPAEAVGTSLEWLNTSVDEFMKDPCGLPLGAILCLRNIARALGKLPNEGEAVEAALQAVPGENEEIEATEEDKGQTNGVEEHGGVQPEVKVVSTNTRKAILLRKVFGNIRQHLFFTLSHNHVLREYVGDVLRSLAKSGAF